MQPFKEVKIVITDEQKKKMLAEVKQQFPDKVDEAEDIIKEHIESKNNTKTFVNDKYRVTARKVTSSMVLCDVIWLSLQRVDGKAIHSWKDLQDIKNQLVGPNHEAIEIYPAESRLVDTSYQYHLWVFSDPTYRVPLGYTERLVLDKSVPTPPKRPSGSKIDPVASKTKRRKGVLKKKKSKKR